MPHPKKHTAYLGEYQVLDRALAEPNGIQVRYATHDEATHVRSRLHYARQVDRDRNSKIYTENEPLHGTSIYDGLICRIRPAEPGGFWLRIVPSVPHGEVEAIQSVEATCTSSPQNTHSNSGEQPLLPSTGSPSPLQRRI